MNNKKGMILLSLGSLVCLTVGFVLGQVVQAVTAMPGSADDPLVSQSYVEKIVGERTAAIQTQLDELKANVNKGGSTTTTTPNNNTTTPNNNNTTSNNNTNTSNNNTTTTNKTVTINAESLNVRGGAGTTYAKVGSVKKGEKYNLLETKAGTDGNWYKIKLSDGKEGWVSSQYAKVN